jgi:hypothetical protein
LRYIPSTIKFFRTTSQWATCPQSPRSPSTISPKWSAR